MAALTARDQRPDGHCRQHRAQKVQPQRMGIARSEAWATSPVVPILKKPKLQKIALKKIPATATPPNAAAPANVRKAPCRPWKAAAGSGWSESEGSPTRRSAGTREPTGRRRGEPEGRHRPDAVLLFLALRSQAQAVLPLGRWIVCGPGSPNPRSFQAQGGTDLRRSEEGGPAVLAFQGMADSNTWPDAKTACNPNERRVRPSGWRKTWLAFAAPVAVSRPWRSLLLWLYAQSAGRKTTARKMTTPAKCT